MPYLLLWAQISVLKGKALTHLKIKRKHTEDLVLFEICVSTRGEEGIVLLLLGSHQEL
jgi:hypothetical protein